MIASVGRMMRKGGGGLSWPAGMKEHIKAWYDPKKQGMTNFDVIESYADDFTKWRIENTGVTSTQKKIVIAAGTELKYNVTYKGFGNSIAEFDIKFNVVSTDGNLITTAVYSVYINDGSIIDVPIISEEIFNNKEETNIYYDFGTNKDIEIDVELIADYPNQLCYDGKSYAVCYGFPILTDYTVMAERTWFENRNVFLAKGNITTEAKYAFIFERFKPDGVMAVQSFGAWNDVVSTTDSYISYLTKNKYNGIDIRSGIGADDDMLSIGGALNKGNIELTSVCCHGAIIVADRSFTEEEINWLKDNLFRK